MRINRRNLVGILAGAGPLAWAQAPPAPAPKQATRAAADPELLSARDDLKFATQRIAQVELPRSVEPAFHFRA
ncbi:MAG TPA: hypothetical protein VKV74_10750 [Bryobacteraceae bacterium]|nr:hypothetical protein [Bryobacteraceae bacterium]